MFKRYDAYLVGYYGMRNSGDDALMLASHWAANKLMGFNKILVSSHGELTGLPGYCQENRLPTAPIFRGQQRISHYLAALQSERIIFGGGSVLHSYRDIELKRHLMKLANPGKSMALGIGLGPFADKAAQLSCSKFLNECGFVGLRDQQSFELAKKLAPNANLHNTFDLAPSLLWHPDLELASKRQGILFNLCPLALNAFGVTDAINEANRLNAICQVIEALWQRHREPIAIININGNSAYGDWQLSDGVVRQLQGRVPIELIPYQSNPLKVIQTISSFKTMVSMRLHGNIFAYMAGVPSVALNYHRKCWQWCQQVGVPGTKQFHAKHFDKAELLEAIQDSLLAPQASPSLDTETAANLALKNWSKRHEQPAIFRGYPFVQQRKTYH